MPRRLFAEFVAVEIAVKTKPDKKFVPGEKACPFVVDAGAVGLNTVINAAVLTVQFVYRVNKKPEKFFAGKCRFSALKGKGNALTVGKSKRLFNQRPCRVRGHNTEAEMLSVLGNVPVKAVFARKVAK